MSNVTPLEIAGIVARVFDISPLQLATRLTGGRKSWPRSLAARAVAARLIGQHTTANRNHVQKMFGMSGAYSVLACADKRLTAELRADPTLRDLVAKAETEIDKLHEAREEAIEAELRRRAMSDAARCNDRAKEVRL